MAVHLGSSRSAETVPVLWIIAAAETHQCGLTTHEADGAVLCKVALLHKASGIQAGPACGATIPWADRCGEEAVWRKVAAPAQSPLQEGLPSLLLTSCCSGHTAPLTAEGAVRPRSAMSREAGNELPGWVLGGPLPLLSPQHPARGRGSDMDIGCRHCRLEWFNGASWSHSGASELRLPRKVQPGRAASKPRAAL